MLVTRVLGNVYPMPPWSAHAYLVRKSSSNLVEGARCVIWLVDARMQMQRAEPGVWATAEQARERERLID